MLKWYRVGSTPQEIDIVIGFEYDQIRFRDGFHGKGWGSAKVGQDSNGAARGPDEKSTRFTRIVRNGNCDDFDSSHPEWLLRSCLRPIPGGQCSRECSAPRAHYRRLERREPWSFANMVDVFMTNQEHVDIREPERVRFQNPRHATDPDSTVHKENSVSGANKERVPATAASQTGDFEQRRWLPTYSSVGESIHDAQSTLAAEGEHTVGGDCPDR